MGWSGGSGLMLEVILSLKKHVTLKARHDVYWDIIPAFEDADCDSLIECVNEDPAFRAAYRELHPPEDQE